MNLRIIVEYIDAQLLDSCKVLALNRIREILSDTGGILVAGTGDKRRRGITRADVLIFASLLPLLGVLLYDSESFILGWNEGRSGLLFGAFFLLMEWQEARNLLKVRLTRKREIAFALCVALLSLFFIAVYAFDLHAVVAEAGKTLNVQNDTFLKNWVWLWEYIVLAVYMLGVVTSLFTVRSISKFSVPFVYLLGMASILLLDGVYPYESLGFLQGMVPMITEIVLGLLWLSGVYIMRSPELNAPRPSVQVIDNMLAIRGTTGYMNLLMYWPCVGVLSMLIYSLIIIILMVKLEAPLKRKIMYAAVGAVGTFITNILRIFMITYYVAYISVDIKIFHENIGEILFLVWVIAFLMIVTQSEIWISRKRLALTKAS